MNCISRPIRSVIIPFPIQAPRPQPAPRLPLREGLMVLASPIHPHAPDAIWLLGENLLLPANGEPRSLYTACVYVVSHYGRRALPVISCRAWSHAPLAAGNDGHVVWQELAGGIVEAAHRVTGATMEIQGAITAARGWMRRHADTTVPVAHQGSAVLLGQHEHVLCAAAPDRMPPVSASTPQIASILPFVAAPARKALSLAA